jgi:hypothetical protein
MTSKIQDLAYGKFGFNKKSGLNPLKINISPGKNGIYIRIEAMKHGINGSYLKHED